MKNVIDINNIKRATSDRIKLGLEKIKSARRIETVVIVTIIIAVAISGVAIKKVIENRGKGDTVTEVDTTQKDEIIESKDGLVQMTNEAAGILEDKAVSLYISQEQLEQSMGNTAHLGKDSDKKDTIQAGNNSTESVKYGQSSSTSEDTNNPYNKPGLYIQNIDLKILEIHNLVRVKIINDGFNLINTYASGGLGSDGKQINIKISLEMLESSMEKKRGYDVIMQYIKDDKYRKVVEIWKSVSSEIDGLYEYSIKNKVVQNGTYHIDTTSIEKKMLTFSNLTKDIIGE